MPAFRPRAAIGRRADDPQGIHWRRPTARVIVALVLSHWLLDVVSHGPDMPIAPGAGPKLGLGLWNSPLLSIVVEAALYAGGVWIYARRTAATDRIGSVGLWALVGFLCVVYVANVLGPPPPSAGTVAWSAQAMWLLVAWGYWVDRHRRPVAGRRAAR